MLLSSYSRTLKSKHFVQWIHGELKRTSWGLMCSNLHWQCGPCLPAIVSSENSRKMGRCASLLTCKALTAAFEHGIFKRKEPKRRNLLFLGYLGITALRNSPS